MNPFQPVTDSRTCTGLAVPPLSVLHVAQPHDGGVPRVARNLLADQASRGWTVFVACPSDSELFAMAKEVGAARLRWPARRVPGQSIVQETRALQTIIRAVNPHLVHLHSAKAGLAGRLGMRGQVPTVFQPHAWSFEAARGPEKVAAIAWERWAARWTDAIVCVSADESERGAGVGIRGRVVVVPNGVDLSGYRVASDHDRRLAQQALGLNDGPMALVIGRLCEQKGQDLILRAWPSILERMPDASLVLIGEGPDRPALEAAGVPNVHLVGQQDDVSDWLAATDVVAIPSRYEAGLSLVAMEAMARGRSVVACDVAGTRIGMGEGAGAIVPMDELAPLIEALTPRLADRRRADAEGAVGRRRVEAHYDLRKATSTMAELYLDILRRRTTRRWRRVEPPRGERDVRPDQPSGGADGPRPDVSPMGEDPEHVVGSW
jgi:glycosyltransferase involved in cell wall biosynthesis